MKSGHHPERTSRILALAAMIGVVAHGAERPPTPVTVVSEVDLDRYAGRWHEIARLPNRFQEDCACCVTATYTVREDGRLTVVNECRTADGTPKSAEGEAKLAAKDGPSGSSPSGRL